MNTEILIWFTIAGLVIRVYILEHQIKKLSDKINPPKP